MIRGLVLDYAGVLTGVDAHLLVNAVRSARSDGIRTALLSNAAGGPEARRGLEGLFDAMLFSGEVGVAKPNAEVYRMTAYWLGVAAEECVFIDDSPRNVAGAVMTGMVGVRHVSVEETLAELAVLLGSPNRPSV